MKFSNIHLYLLASCLMMIGCQSKTNNSPNTAEQLSTKTVALKKSVLTIDDFAWIAGTFDRINAEPGVENIELWTRKNDNEYEAMVIDIKDGKRTITAVMNLQVKQKRLIVRHLEGKPTIFKLTDYDETSFTVENKENDFPKKIHYKKTEAGIQATISGGGQAILFDFETSKSDTKLYHATGNTN